MITVGASATGGWNADKTGPGWFTVTGTDEQVAAYIEGHGHLAYDLGSDEEYEAALATAPLVCKALRVGPYEEQCEHGLSAWLCTDPISHYPRDL